MSSRAPISAVAIAATLALTAAPAFASNHAERQWIVQESAHFQIHYYAGIERTAARVLKAAEEAYPKLKADFGVTIADAKVPIILDQDSFFNGEAEPLKDRITLDPALASSSVVGTQRFVGHELAHVMTFRAMSKGNNLAKLNGLGGLPTWFLEGVAQYEAEYWYPSLDRMLRLHTVDNSLLTTTERANFRMLGVHAGAAGYNEGYSLCRYMFDTHGRDKLAVLMKHLREGNKTWEQAVEATFGKTLVAIESGWRQGLREGYTAQIKGLQDRVPGAKLVVDTFQGEVNVQPRLAPDGKRMAWLTSRHQDGFLYLRGNVMGFLSLFVGDADGKNGRMVPIGRGAVSNFGWSADGKQLVYARVVKDELSNPGFDVFVYDVATQKTDRLTENEGANHMAWRPKSTQVAYVSVKDGQNVVKLIDTRTKKVTTLYRPTGEDQFRDPAWSPDGLSLVMVTHLPGGNGRLVVLDVEGGTLRALAPSNKPGADSAPTWTPNGKQVVFTSERSGMSNLYVVNATGTGAAQPLTNTFRGADTPTVTPDGQAILFTTYKSKGSSIQRIPFGQAAAQASTPGGTTASEPAPPREPLNSARTAAPVGRTSTVLGAQSLGANGFSVGPELPPSLHLPVPTGDPIDRALVEQFAIKATKPYKATMTNDMLIPQMASDEKGQQLGVAALYSDILDKHQLGVDVRFGLMSQRFSYLAQYTNRMFSSSWNVSLFDQPQIALSPDVGSNAGAILDSLYFQRLRGASLGVLTPLPGGRSLMTSAQMGTLSTLVNPQVGSYGQLREGQLNTLSAVLSEQNVKGSVDSDINPSDGYRMGLGMTLSDKSIGSGFNYAQYMFQGERYFAMIPDLRHNLTWRWNLGLINGDAPQPFLVGGANGSNPIFALRGYAVGAMSGTRLATTGLEYTLPIMQHIDKMVGPVYLDRLYVSTFTDAGSAWSAGMSSNPYASAGAEIRLRTMVMGRQMLTLRVGLAKKLGSNDFPGFYVTF